MLIRVPFSCPHSGQPRQENAIRVVFKRLPSGGVARTVPGRYAMLVVCVCLSALSPALYLLFLDYAKLVRKHIQLAEPGAPPPQIDMETLRASARAADQEKSNARAKQMRAHDHVLPLHDTKVLPQEHHQGSFQIITTVPADPPPPLEGMNHIQPQSQVQPPTQQSPLNSNGISPVPWGGHQSQPQASNGLRGYPNSDQVQHQSFMRSSQQRSPA